MIEYPPEVAFFSCRHHIAYLDIHKKKVTYKKTIMSDPSRPPYNPWGRCVKFDRILERAFRLSSNRKDMIRHFWEVVGFLMMPPKNPVHKVIWYGDRGSGLFFIKKILDSVIHFRAMKRLQLVVDASKEMHTDDYITKAIVVPFWGDFQKIGPYEVDHTIITDSAGILRKGMKGVERLLDRGRFQIPIDCEEATLRYFRCVDHIGKFMRECTTIVDDLSISVTLKQIYKVYLEWCQSIKLRVGKNELGQEIRARGVKYMSKDGIDRKFLGLKIKPQYC